MVEVHHLRGDAGLVEHLVGDPDRRLHPHGERDGVGGAGVEHLRSARRRQAQLGIERAVVDAGHVDPLDAGAHRTEERRDEVVRQWTRRLLALHGDEDRGGLLRADPDGQDPPLARLLEQRLQQHDVLPRGIQRDTEHANLDHGPSRLAIGCGPAIVRRSDATQPNLAVGLRRAFREC